MWEHILILGAGIIIGGVALLVTIALLSANKPDEIAASYEKGFNDGCKHQENHTK